MNGVIRFFSRTIPNPALPDGRMAAALRLIPLRAELQRLKIPGIAATMHKDDLIAAYAAHLDAVAASLKSASGHAPAMPGDDATPIAAKAAKLIEAGAAP